MDAYRIGISIVLANGVSPVLHTVMTDLMGLRTRIGDVERSLATWKAPLLGFAAILGGATVLGTIDKLIDKSKDFQDQLIKLQRLGGGMAEAVKSGAITAQAFDISRRVPMRVEDLMKIPGMTYSIMGEEEARKTWEPLARFAWVLQSDRHYNGDTNKDLQALIRAGELSGRITDPVTKQIDAVKLEKFLDLAARVTAATHGMVNAQSMLGMAQQGGVALRGLNDQGFYTMAIMAQAMGGHRAGTAYLSLWQQMAGGTMMKRTAEGLQEMGLLQPGEWSTEGGHVSISKDASKRLTNLIGKDPLELAANIQKQLAERGVTNPLEQMDAIMRLTGRQTTQRFTAEEVANFSQMMAERGRLMQGLGAEGSFGLITDKSVTANMQALSNAWSNLLTAVAGPNSDKVVTVLQALTATLNSMQAAVTSETTKAVESVIGTIAADIAKVDEFIMKGLGWISGITPVFRALGDLPWQKIADGAASVSAAIGNLAGVSWERIVAIFDGIRNAIASFIDRLGGILGRFGNHGQPGVDIEGAPKSPTRFEGGSDMQRGRFIPAQFNPGTKQLVPIVLHSSLNMDGEKLTQMIIDKIDDMTTSSTGAAAADGMSRYAGGDHHWDDT